MGKPSDYDVAIGRNVRDLRKARGMTQADLATALVDRGLPAFHQQTVLKIENGSRPLRLREAHEIASVLDLNLEDLIQEQAVVDRAALLATHVRSVYAAWEDLTNGVRRLLEAQNHVRFTLDHLKLGAVVPTHLLDEAASMLKADPAAIAKSAVKRYAAEVAAQEADYESAVIIDRYRSEERGVD